MTSGTKKDSEFPIAYAVRVGGRVNDVQEQGVVHQAILAKHLESNGFKHISKYRSVMPFDIPRQIYAPGRKKRTSTRKAMDGGSSQLVIACLFFVGSSVGRWAIGQVCSYLKEAIEETWISHDVTSDDDVLDLRYKLSIWYDVNLVNVVLNAEIRTIRELKQLSDLIEQTGSQAEEWIKEHGVQGTELVYHFRHGQLSPVPNIRSHE